MQSARSDSESFHRTYWRAACCWNRQRRRNCRQWKDTASTLSPSKDAADTREVCPRCVAGVALVPSGHSRPVGHVATPLQPRGWMNGCPLFRWAVNTVLCLLTRLQQHTSAVTVTSFIPRDAYAQRELCRGKMSVCLSARLSVCLSVCLSHAGIMSKRLYISSVFLPSRSPTILVFPHQTRDGNIPTRTLPPNGGVEC